MKVLLLLCFLSAAVSAAPARLTFVKTFPGSTPPYVFIQVDRTGALEYKESTADTEQPLQAHMKEAAAAEMFALADKLSHFKEPIESGLKVANTGKKIFRYQPESGVPTETTFNYSILPDAQQLLDRFEQISYTERAYIELDRTIHFDKLGVNDALAQIEELWLRKQLSAPEQFVPLLTRVATHESFMHLVRERAARLRDEFTGTVPETAGAEPKAQ